MKMKILASIAVLFLCIAALLGCSPTSRRSPIITAGSSPPPDFPISAEFPNYPKIVATANRLVSEAGLKWGEPVDVRWQPAPLNRYLIIYPTPQSELGYAGYRIVQVETNWHAWFPLRG